MWACLSDDGKLVQLTEVTTTLAVTLRSSLPNVQLPPPLLCGLLNQLLMIMEKDLPMRTLQVVVNCLTDLLPQVAPSHLLWLVSFAPSLTKVVHKVMESSSDQPVSQVLLFKGRVVTVVLRVQSLLSLYILSQSVNYLASVGPHPYLALISTWLCSVLHSGIFLDVRKVQVTGKEGCVVSLQTCVLNHFHTYRDPHYLQALWLALDLSDVDSICEVMGAVRPREDDSKLTKGVCILLGLYLSQDSQVPPDTPETVACIQTAR